MRNYLVRRLLQSVVLFVLITVITFAVIRIAPGGPAILANPNLSKSQITALRAGLGLEDPLPVQYARWMRHVLQGELGTSFNESVPVTALIRERLPNTLLLGAAAFTVAVSCGLAFGILSAVKHNTWLDRLFSVVGVLNLSVPVFWLAIVLILVFAVQLGWLPSFGRGDTVAIGWWTTGLLTTSGLKSLILPSITLALFQTTLIMRLVRAEMLEVLRTDYIKFARARGLTDRAVHFGHALRNTLVPVITITGLQLGSIIAFAIITETVFQWPGMGLLFIQAVTFADIPVMAAYLCFIAAVFVTLNLIVDLLYYAVDPRLRVERGTGH